MPKISFLTDMGLRDHSLHFFCSYVSFIYVIVWSVVKKVLLWCSGYHVSLTH